MSLGQGIGEVLAELRADFPETTISKLRFLEAEGLVNPRRTPAGYRRYSREDVARLRYVLTAQRDHYLPLRVIKDHLDAIDGGQAPPKLAQIPAQATEIDAVTESDISRYDRQGLAALVGQSADWLDEIAAIGLVSVDADGFFGEDAVVVAKAAAELAGFGVEPRHLRSFRAAADRETGLFQQVLAPIAKQRDGVSRASEVAERLLELATQLRTALVRAGLRTTLVE